MRSLIATIALCCACITQSFASHYSAADIRYQWVGPGNVYKVFLTTYKLCSPGAVGLPTTEQIHLSSTSASISFYRMFNQVSYDTLSTLICPGAQNSCQLSSSTYPGIITAVYSDTVTLNPQTDWYISWQSTARTSAIVNIQNPSGMQIGVSAFLNNSMAINSSAWIVNKPPLMLANNFLNSSPLNTIDFENDSLVYEFYQPAFTTFLAPYSLANPVNGYLGISNGNLLLQTMNTGMYCMALRVKEYRAGVLVGYSSRDWNTTTLGGPQVKQPFVQNGSSPLQIVSCPGQTHTLNYTFADSNASDSIIITMLPNNSNAPVITPVISNGSPTGAVSLSFTTPASLNPATTPYYYIPMLVRNNQCYVRGLSFYTVAVMIAPCNTDSVWAGDANDDQTVNIYDPLAISVAYGQTGTARIAPTTTWVAQYCPNWTGSFINNVNMKFADCDGNGTVNSTDLPAVTANWGLTHPKGGWSNQTKTTGLPDLYFDLTGINLVPGTTVNIPVKLGTSATNIINFYGLATHIKVNGLNLSATPSISYPASWLGTAANTLRFTKNVSNNELAWAYARNDHQDQTGQGTVGTLSFTVPANTQPGTQVQLLFGNSKLIDKNGNEITAVNVLNDTTYVQSTSSVNPAAGAGFTASVVPNPSGNMAALMLQMPYDGSVNINITDLAGRIAWKESIDAKKGVQSIDIPAAQLQSGIYLVRIEAAGGQQVMKWIRN